MTAGDERPRPSGENGTCAKKNGEDMSSYTEGQVHQLANALEGVGFTPEDVTKLGQSRDLGDIRGVLRGTHEIKPIPHLIDCDAAPFIPDGWTVEEHREGGRWRFSPSKVEIYLSTGQKGDKRVEGAKLRTELAKKPVLNANVLDYLLKSENQHLIPEDWKGKYIYFWGTIYRDLDGNLCVRYLYWNVDRWSWDYAWLVFGWGSRGPAAVLAS